MKIGTWPLHLNYAQTPLWSGAGRISVVIAVATSELIATE
jgi:hypothetical protein